MLNQVVEYTELRLDAIYSALAHPIRREVIGQLSGLGGGGARVTELSAPFPVSLAAVSKHIRVLEDAGLVRRSISGREHHLSLEPQPLEAASSWLESYRRFWTARLDLLEAQLRREPQA